MKVFFATDIHGSQTCFLKFLNAGKFYGAEALIFGGDLTSKIVVPVVEGSASGRHGVHTECTWVASARDADKAEERLRAQGLCPARLSPEQLIQMHEDEQFREKVMSEAITATAQAWVNLADSRLAEGGTECYMLAGNDDPEAVVEILRHAEHVVCHDGRVAMIKGELPLLGCGYSNHTPFSSPREMAEDDLLSMLHRLFSAVSSPSHVILNAHCPPSKSGLDWAPEITPELKVVSYGGQPHMVPVGSTSVRKAIEDFQPFLALHGHCHESPGKVRIRKTVCLNPGSLYGEGILCGALLHIVAGQLRDVQFVRA